MGLISIAPMVLLTSFIAVLRATFHFAGRASLCIAALRAFQSPPSPPLKKAAHQTACQMKMCWSLHRELLKDGLLAIIVSSIRLRGRPGKQRWGASAWVSFSVLSWLVAAAREHLAARN